jgi:hypothetical protein
LLCFQAIPVNPAFVTSDYKGHEIGIFWVQSRRSVQIDMQSSFCSTVRRQGTNFAVTRLIRKSSVRIFWHVPNANLISSATSLVRRRSARKISRTCATVSSVWEVEGLPGLGSSSKDRRPLLKWEYHSNVFDDDLGRTLRKLLAAFRTFQHQFSPDGNRNQCTHAAALSPPS